MTINHSHSSLQMPVTVSLKFGHEKVGVEMDEVTSVKKPYILIEPSIGYLSVSDAKQITNIFNDSSIKHQWFDKLSCFKADITDMWNVVDCLQRGGICIKDKPSYFVWQTITEHQEHKFVTEQDIVEKIGSGIWNQLMPYQKFGVTKMITEKKCANYDLMGLGKTLQALVSVKFFEDKWPVLVACPSSLRYTWKSEAIQWLQLNDSDIMVGKSTAHLLRNISSKHKFLVVSYSLLSNKKVTDALKHKYEVAIFDECHYVKSSGSKRSQAALHVAKDCSVVIMLSGSPFAYPVEMYQQIRFINPNIYPKFFTYSTDAKEDTSFAKRYCKPVQKFIRKKPVWEFKGYENHEEFNLVLNTFMIRRRKEDVLKQLPPKMRTCITLQPLCKPQEKEITSLLTNEKDKAEKDREKYMLAFRLTGKHKTPGVLQFIKEQIIQDVMKEDETVQCLIFFHHEVMRDALKTCLDEQKMSYFVIDGSTSPEDRNTHKNDFQTTNKYRIGLLSLMAASVGLTLTRASLVVFAEVLFGPDIHLQAEDRAHRIGQKNSVNIFYLIQPNTTDDINFGMIKKKERESSIMLDGASKGITSKRSCTIEMGLPDQEKEQKTLALIVERPNKKMCL